ncbi:alpha/beta-hydrolase [Rhizoclosmatium globosum]|uniref:Alpha/beta-hydrolase n=1 Tax=Rhizoclosmatium globosum TaxID=329046 RepID=A0A1Y2CLI1_9FUNG|nr:alpha/beta-hydrolase [Rhizoclosmatium globosum]|eukprot:ORY47807.1 alpha/beta-hydrolase [Rhizoclosmatium globosum]
MEGMAPQGRHSTDICRLISRFSVPSVLARAEVVAVKGELGEAVKGERLKLWHRVCDVVGVDPSTVEYDATVDRLKGEWVKNWDVGSVVKERASVTLFIHGGAHIFMSPGTHRGLTSHISKETNGPVFALDYSLAPEAIFPVAIFETLLVYSSLIGTPEFNGFPTSYHTIFANPLSKASFRPEQIQIMGDSSGGCLVTQTLLVMKALGIQMPNCAVLMSPFVDATCNSPSFTLNWTSDFLTLDPTGMQWALSAYSGKNTSKAHPSISRIPQRLFGPVSHLDSSWRCGVLLNDSIMLFEG